MCNNQNNGYGMAFSYGVALTANVIAYFGMKNLRMKKQKQKNKEYEIAFSNYESGIKKSNHYLREKQIFLQSSINNETKNLGLLIVEAYYGL